jgi:hypothetical protein
VISRRFLFWIERAFLNLLWFGDAPLACAECQAAYANRGWAGQSLCDTCFDIKVREYFHELFVGEN